MERPFAAVNAIRAFIIGELGDDLIPRVKYEHDTSGALGSLEPTRVMSSEARAH